MGEIKIQIYFKRQLAAPDAFQFTNTISPATAANDSDTDAADKRTATTTTLARIAIGTRVFFIRSHGHSHIYMIYNNMQHFAISFSLFSLLHSFMCMCVCLFVYACVRACV